MTHFHRFVQAATLMTLLPCAGCHRLSDRDAVALVNSYNEHVIQAYRAGDLKLAGGVTGPEELKKLAGLIGVKLDQGITLDAQLLDSRVVTIDRDGGDVLVTTEERWYYLDRRIGTGEKVGQDSTDRYKVRYRLRRVQGTWVVGGIEFAAPPEVGRGEVLNHADVSTLHGLDRGAPPTPAPGNNR